MTNITFVEAWRKNEPKHTADAIAFWTEHGLLKADTPVEERAKQIAVLAYDGDKLVGLSTLNVRPFELLRQKFAFLREAIAPDYRLHSIARALSGETRKVIEAHAIAHPDEMIAGMASVYQAKGIGKKPIGSVSRMALIGYTEFNEQVRASWFEHFRIPGNLAPISEFAKWNTGA
ncbi:MAG: hypothetical protein Q7S99_05440 [Parvibaculum sp.]|nr:hypothetical protein [Parvibaculum sp.]|tara:strand:- start:2440 stop:2964 length:525 start_codon:yes stop_codon:yes gene_type:complete